MIRSIILVALLVCATANAEIKEIYDGGLWYKHGEIGNTGYPSYSGALGTATNKTIPVAVRSNGHNYYVHSDCKNGQYQIRVQKDDEKSIIFRSSYCDQHDNAAIRVASDGHVFVYKSARGFWRKSYAYKSKRPYDISEFEIVDSGYKAYPQAWSMGLLYTKYKNVGGGNGLRELWITTNTGDELKLVSGGHYSVSYYDGEFIHLFYNLHKNGDLNNRGGVYYMRSSNGVNWQNRRGEALALPLEPDSELTKVMPHDGTLVYLKDMKVVNGLPVLLFAKSTTWNPTEGRRELWEVDAFGNETYITNQSHNYDGAAYFGHSDHIIAVVKGKDFGYAGGDIFFYHKGQEIGGIFNGKANNYPRKVLGFRGFVYGSTESSEYNDGGTKTYLFK